MVKLLIALIIALSIVFVFVSQDKAKTTNKGQTTKAPVNESEKINKYLQEIEFNKKAQAIKTGKDMDHQDVNLKENNDDILNKDLNAGSVLNHQEEGLSLHDQIEAEKLRMQSEFESHADPTNAYVQQFIENARKDGLLIKVDKNNQIIDIKKLAE